MGHQNLCFPEWQGYAESNTVYHSTLALRNGLAVARDFDDMPVPENEEVLTINDIKGYEPNLRHLRHAAQLLIDRKPDSIFMIAGTCASEIAPVSWLNKRYDGDLTVLWFDAHGDLNTPSSSPSKHFHGMPLRTLLGDGDPTVLKACFSRLKPSQVALVGARDLDDEERRYIENNDISVLPVHNLDALTDTIREKSSENLYVHMDLDVLEPTSFPHQLLSVDRGMTKESLLTAVRELAVTFNIVGSSILEYVPKDASGLHFLQEIVDVLEV